MSSLMESLVSSTNSTVKAIEDIKSSKDEFIISMETIVEQKTPKSESLRNENIAKVDSLQELFDQTVKEKGDYPLAKKEWKGDNELVVDGLSPMTLHSFVSKAEQLGKKISYERTLKVKITD